MTTAHRPTWNAAQGSDAQGGSLRGVASRATSKFDSLGQTKLHYRQEGQNAPSELKAKDFRAELEEKERRAKEKRARDDDDDVEEERKRPRLEDRKGGEALETNEKEQAPVARRFNPEDKDDSDSSEDDDRSSSDSDDDETAELMRELERIQKERAEEQKRIDKERQAASIVTNADAVLHGNPLNATKDDFTVKKKWYEDTVFRNQARGAPEQKKPRFINDTIRNDFHKKFLSKYIK